MEILSLFWITSILGALSTLIYWFSNPFKMLLVSWGWVFVEVTSSGDKIRANHYLKKLQKMKKYTSVITFKNDREVPTKLVVSFKPFLMAHVSVSTDVNWRGNSRDTIHLSLFCSRENFQELFEKDKPQEKQDNGQTMKILARMSAGYYDPDYDLQTVDAPDEMLDCFPEQQRVVEHIVERWEAALERKCRKMAFLIHGESGNGKSEIAAIIAARLNGTLCNEYLPTKPGDKINRIHQMADVSQESPLIILIDEWDVLLKKIWANEMKPNDDVDTEVTDRSSHNRWMDTILNGPFIPYTIVIFTTNRTPAELKEITDESCMRRLQVIENRESPEHVLKMVEERRYGQISDETVKKKVA